MYGLRTHHRPNIIVIYLVFFFFFTRRCGCVVIIQRSTLDFFLQLDIKKKNLDVTEVCREVVETAVVHEVPGISKAVVVTGPDGEPWLRTEGINVQVFAPRKKKKGVL